MAEGSSIIRRTGVWWDLNTCPVPAGIDPGIIRRCISSALREHFDAPCRVTIFAVGNLEYISPELLEAISSTGILLRHTPFRGSILSRYLLVWRKFNPPPDEVLLISGDNTWFLPFNNEGYTLLRAFPQHLRPSLPAYLPAYSCDEYQAWDWETLLKENSGAVEYDYYCDLCDIPSQSCRCYLKLREVQPTGYCDMCDITTYCFMDFIKHLNGRKHRRELAKRKKINPNLTFPKCKLCQYTAYDNYNMDIHFNSDEHKQNELAAQNLLESSKHAKHPKEGPVHKLIDLTKQLVIPVSMIAVVSTVLNVLFSRK